MDDDRAPSEMKNDEERIPPKIMMSNKIRRLTRKAMTEFR